MDKLDFLDGASAPVEDVQPVAEPVAEASPEPQPQARERDDSGRFKPKDATEPPVAAQPEPQPEPAQQPATEPRAEPIMVPLAALHETRDKVKALEEQLAQFQQRQQPQPQPVVVPDPVLDPDGFAQFQSQQIDNASYGNRLYFSEQLAVLKHGQESFDKMREWGVAKCDSDPMFNAKVRQSQDPYSIVVAEYQRDQIASSVNMTDFEQFKAWQAAQGQLQTQQQQAAPAAVPQPAALPRSIAHAPSAGGVQTIATGPGVAFDEAIK